MSTKDPPPPHQYHQNITDIATVPRSDRIKGSGVWPEIRNIYTSSLTRSANVSAMAANSQKEAVFQRDEEPLRERVFTN